MASSLKIEEENLMEAKGSSRVCGIFFPNKDLNLKETNNSFFCVKPLNQTLHEHAQISPNNQKKY